MTTDPIDNPRKKIPADILAKIEAFHEQIMDPEPGDPILSRADSPRLDSLQRWRDDAVRLGFDPAECGSCLMAMRLAFRSLMLC